MYVYAKDKLTIALEGTLRTVRGISNDLLFGTLSLTIHITSQPSCLQFHFLTFFVCLIWFPKLLSLIFTCELTETLDMFYDFFPKFFYVTKNKIKIKKGKIYVVCKLYIRISRKPLYWKTERSDGFRSRRAKRKRNVF